MNLKSLESYSQKELEQAAQYSEAIPSHLGKILHQDPLFTERYRAWCQAGLATIFNQATPQLICLSWSNTADHILHTICASIKHKDDLALFAFGKLGAHELNLSSDVDLMFVTKNESLDNIKFLRQFKERCMPTDTTDFLFRIDLDLRPGGKMGPIIPTLDQLTDYYGNYGETWERLAFIRLRPIWGSPEIINSVMTFAKQFIYRKHLDFSLLEDLKSLRAKVHEHYWARASDNQVDLKLGVGGIRDIELFVHALQVVHGGRDSRLHQQQTELALEALKQTKVLPAEDVDFLNQHYWQLRSLENFVQAAQDQQTHILDLHQSLPAPLKKIALELPQQLSRCDQIVSTLLGKISAHPIGLPDSEDLQKLWLKKLGFSEVDQCEVWPDIIKTPIFSRQRERDLTIRNRLLFKFVEKISQYPNRLEGALSFLRDFLAAAKAKASFFSMLLSSDPLLETLAALFCSSVYLSRIICARPELLDSIVMRNMETPDSEKMDLEEFLNNLAERRMLAEIFAGGELLRDHDLSRISENLSATADQITSLLMAKICQEANHPTIGILALGKWGGRELGFHSDLDCIFVTPHEPTEADQKIVRRFINRLTENHRGGALYAIDTRLKTSGKGGMILTSLPALKNYLESQAEPWERQAYLRSRWINMTLKPLTPLCFGKALSENEITELNRIRLELLKNQKGSLDLKYCEGGMVDFELAAQTAVLTLLRAPPQPDTLSMTNKLSEYDSGWKNGQELYDLVRLVDQLLKLISGETSPKLTSATPFYKQIEHHLSLSGHRGKLVPLGLEGLLRRALNDQSNKLKKLDPRRAQS